VFFGFVTRFRDMFGHLPSSVPLFLHTASFWTRQCYRLTCFVISIKFCSTVGMGLIAVTVRRCQLCVGVYCASVSTVRRCQMCVGVSPSNVVCHRYNQYCFIQICTSAQPKLFYQCLYMIPRVRINICILILKSLAPSGLVKFPTYLNSYTGYSGLCSDSTAVHNFALK
jgi:hypothetical protein